MTTSTRRKRITATTGFASCVGRKSLQFLFPWRTISSLGKSFLGCRLNHSSPGNMQRHLRRKHMIETVSEKPEDQGEQGHQVDHPMTKDFVYSFVLTDLQPMKTAVKKGFKQFLQKYLRRKVGGEQLVRRYAREWNKFARERVKAKLFFFKKKGPRAKRADSGSPWIAGRVKAFANAVSRALGAGGSLLLGCRKRFALAFPRWPQENVRWTCGTQRRRRWHQ